ncbi:MAG: cytochrome c oxidase subunit CcoM [Pseudomonas sp.]
MFRRKEVGKFFDHVVIAGVTIVGLMLLFFVGFGIFIWKDSNKRNQR